MIIGTSFASEKVQVSSAKQETFAKATSAFLPTEDPTGRHVRQIPKVWQNRTWWKSSQRFRPCLNLLYRCLCGDTYTVGC